jgi:hypothetical protein
MTRSLLPALAALVMFVPAAMADSAPSADEMAKIEAALKAWGCAAGKADDVEKEDSGIYEVDDGKCADGKVYDFRLSKDFAVTTISAD